MAEEHEIPLIFRLTAAMLTASTPRLALVANGIAPRIRFCRDVKLVALLVAGL
jgi:hypothetical protein